MSAKVIPFPMNQPEDMSFELIDLNKELIANSNTYGLTAHGDSMRDDGMETGDLLIVDRLLAPRGGDFVITMHTGNFTVETYAGGKAWGVITYIIRKCR
jgi:SOS-response transcriptional repressor LexA